MYIFGFLITILKGKAYEKRQWYFLTTLKNIKNFVEITTIFSSGISLTKLFKNSHHCTEGISWSFYNSHENQTPENWRNPLTPNIPVGNHATKPLFMHSTHQNAVPSERRVCVWSLDDIRKWQYYWKAFRVERWTSDRLTYTISYFIGKPSVVFAHLYSKCSFVEVLVFAPHRTLLQIQIEVTNLDVLPPVIH